MYIDNLGKIIHFERKSWGMSKGRLAKLSHTDNPVVSICTQIGNWLKSLSFQAKLTPTSA